MIDWVDPANPTDKKRVTCTVTWPGNTGPLVIAIDYITNWQTNNP